MIPGFQAFTELLPRLCPGPRFKTTPLILYDYYWQPDVGVTNTIATRQGSEERAAEDSIPSMRRVKRREKHWPNSLCPATLRHCLIPSIDRLSVWCQGDGKRGRTEGRRKPSEEPTVHMIGFKWHK